MQNNNQRWNLSDTLCVAQLPQKVNIFYFLRWKGFLFYPAAQIMVSPILYFLILNWCYDSVLQLFDDLQIFVGRNKRIILRGGGVILMHLIFCSNEKSETKCFLFKGVFHFSLKKLNKLQKALNFLLSLPYKPNWSDLVVTLFFQKADLLPSHFHRRRKEKCFNTFSFSNQAFLKEIILSLDLLETFIIRLNEIIYSDKMPSGTCSVIIRTCHYSITPDM